MAILGMDTDRVYDEANRLRAIEQRATELQSELIRVASADSAGWLDDPELVRRRSDLAQRAQQLSDVIASVRATAEELERAANQQRMSSRW